jgi:RNA polymerase-binding transcription factor DksA
MDTHPILDKNPSQAAPGIAAPSPALSRAVATSSGAAAAPAMAREALRFPGEDGGKSLSEMAQRDLDATLQLLVERAQYITGASGTAIALREGGQMVCCATAGPSAPDIGTHLQIDSGLSAECVRTRQTLHCDDAENDARVNRESCRALGIKSVVVMPLVRGDEVYGVFELLAGRANAFEERDFIALQRLSEMIQTALDLAEAARRAESELGEAARPAIAIAGTTESASAAPVLDAAEHTQVSESKAAPEIAAAKVEANVTESDLPEGVAELHQDQPDQALPDQARSNQADSAPPVPANVATILETIIAEETLEEVAAPIQIVPGRFGKVGNCESCGFPISEGRRLCLDCEAASPGVPSAGDAPRIFAPQLESESSWVRSHLYLIAAAALVVATLAIVVWRF